MRAVIVITGSLLLLLGACNLTEKNLPTAASTADVIYFDGTIITVNDAQPNVEAVALKDGKILAVGTRADIEKQNKGATTQMINLGGKTMIPGFVDGHSHFVEVGTQSVSANLLPAPDGPVNAIPELQQALRDFMATSAIVKAHHIVVGMNYDNSQMVEQRHPTRQELDAVSTKIPIMISHQSGHIGVLNSKALEMAGISAATPNPPGGVIEREADGKTPNGVLQETAFFMAAPKLMPTFTPDELIAQIQGGEAHYIANGFTTAQDGKTSVATLKVLPEIARMGGFKIDVVSYADLVAVVDAGDEAILQGPLMSRSYTNHFRIGGVKLTLDGSPQGKTAWFTHPYFKVPSGQDKNYAGYPAFTDAKLHDWVNLAYKNNWQLLAHTNGDAAIDQLIRIVQDTAASYPPKDRRTVMIHGQLLRADQIPQIKELGIFPSEFPMHTFYWGDYYRESVVGPARAENISPTGWLLKSDMKFSIHSDAPVVFPDAMRLISTAVNRVTRSGYILGPKQRISPLVALKAMTIWPAYQHFEEATKGSIEVGKIADLVILSDNPLTVDHAKIIDIKVDETIKDGKVIYQRGLATTPPAINCATDTACGKALNAPAQFFVPAAIDD
ncbi:amidohydrolase [Glaciimonas soli]|uniref:Amidohydrolase family protein n=1 Tax=Glaciimonas soli TaxID=2590999 RepID=A0A843YPH6_9BURK|nr:amidohydrolase [Glaciimonas soli]MQQ99201.1 amidohydrolase family protein [Glaciimonas soli]